MLKVGPSMGLTGLATDASLAYMHEPEYLVGLNNPPPPHTWKQKLNKTLRDCCQYMSTVLAWMSQLSDTIPGIFPCFYNECYE